METAALLKETEKLGKVIATLREEKEAAVSEATSMLQIKVEEAETIKTNYEAQIKQLKVKAINWKATALKLKDSLTNVSRDNVSCTQETRLPLLNDIAELNKLKQQLDLDISNLKMQRSISISVEDLEAYTRTANQASYWKENCRKLSFKFIKFLRGFSLDVIELKHEVQDFQDSAISESRNAMMTALLKSICRES